MPNKIIPQEHRDAMVASYLAGATAKEAAGQFGYTTKACYFALRQEGITSRTNGETHRKYPLDETLFDVVDAEEKAYWLGFLTADGTIGDDHIILALQERDVQHLRKFTSSLCSSHPVCLRENRLKEKVYHYGQVHIGSSHLTTAIKRLGIGERKSFTVCPCEDVPEHLLSHYWRGMFDGDGFITPYQNRGKGAHQWAVGLVGNYAIVSGFASFVQSSVQVKATVIPHSNIFMVRYSGTATPQMVIHLLYHNATIFLDRKQELATDIQQAIIQRVNRSEVTKESLEELYALHGTWQAVASAMGTSIGRLYHIKKRVGLL